MELLLGAHAFCYSTPPILNLSEFLQGVTVLVVYFTQKAYKILRRVFHCTWLILRSADTFGHAMLRKTI